MRPSFTPSEVHPADGDAPSDALMEGADGKLYGTDVSR